MQRDEQKTRSANRGVERARALSPASAVGAERALAEPGPQFLRHRHAPPGGLTKRSTAGGAVTGGAGSAEPAGASTASRRGGERDGLPATAAAAVEAADAADAAATATAAAARGGDVGSGGGDSGAPSDSTDARLVRTWRDGGRGGLADG